MQLGKRFSPQTYDVLVVGAGPAGLTTAIALARYGVRTLVVERHPGTSIFPRATGVSTRTMEVFRSWGIDGQIRALSMRVENTMSVSDTLADQDRKVIPLGFPPDDVAKSVSPTWPAAIAQDRLEPVLVEHLVGNGGEVRFGTELVGLQMSSDGAVATLRELDGETTYDVQARYVVGADGPRSAVRQHLGIGVREVGFLGEWISVLFRGDLAAAAGEHRYGIYSVEHPEAGGVMLPADAHDRWVSAWPAQPGESLERWSSDRIAARLRAATGVPSLQPQIEATMQFAMQSEMATAYRAGNGFLVGDAAHRMTPVGGTGMNTAIQAAHNLGWKLAWVIRGWAGEELLDSYEAERRPVGERNTLRSVRAVELEDEHGLILDLGQVYRSDVVMADGSGPAHRPGAFVPTAAPGARAPHAWVTYSGRRMSTLDLFGDRLTVLTGRRGRAWRNAAARLADSGVPMSSFTFGWDLHDLDNGLDSTYEIGDEGAVLVRPDGHVAWRCTSGAADPDRVLAAAVAATLGHAEVDSVAMVS